MNEQLQQSLAAILDKTVSGVEAGAAFLQAEIPDVVHQLLVWKMAQAGIEVIFLAFCIYSYIWFFGFYKRQEEGSIWKNGYNGPDVPAMAVFTIGGFSSIFGATVIFYDISTMIQIWLAPKIYLIEYAASLAK